MEIENDSTQRKPGGWKAIPYVLGNESFEKLASMSLIANLTVFLSTKYNLEGIFLVNVVNIWSGSSNVVTLVGAFVSDAYLGRFLTIFYGSILALLGMGIMTLTAGVPHLRPLPCHAQPNCQQPQKWQLGILFMGLGLLAVASGCLRPCNVAFGADQFDETTKKGRAQLERFFNYWYLSFTVALLIALTGVVYVQTSVSWLIGFAIPTVCMMISAIIFVMGRKIYVCKKPRGSVFLDMAKVMVASFNKRHVKVGPDDDVTLYDPPLMGDAESESPKMRHTDRFKWLDKAALVVDFNELDSQGVPKNNWRLCSVHQVEQLKCLVGIVPVWFSGIGCFISMDQQESFGMLQAMQLNTSVGPHFKIPPAWMTIVGMLSLAIWIISYEQIYIPKISKFFKRGARLTVTQKIQTGIVVSILCMLTSGIVEKQRRKTALKNGTFKSPLSITILLPQFILSGLINAFTGVALMVFFTMQLPESMRSVSGALFFLNMSISSYLSSLITIIIHASTGKNGKTPWLGGHDLNKNRLDYFYYIIAAFGLVNFMYFTFFARRYVFNSDINTESTSESNMERSGEP